MALPTIDPTTTAVVVETPAEDVVAGATNTTSAISRPIIAISASGVSAPKADYDVIKSFPALDSLSLTQIARKSGRIYLLKQKSLPPIDQLGTDYERLFNAECRFLQRFTHHGLPQIAEFFVRQRSLHLVLTLIEGSTLREQVQGTSASRNGQESEPPDLPSLDRVMYWAEQLAELLLLFHRQKPFPLIHGNISPNSILIHKQSGEVRLLDFGLLRSFCAIQRANEKEVAFEFGLCADPALSNLQQLTVQSDIFAYGRVLDFLLTGLVPTSRYDPIRAVGIDSQMSIDPRFTHLAQIAEHCCHPSMAERYKSAADILSDLIAFHHRPSLDARPTHCLCGETNRQSARFCKRCGQLLYKPVDIAAKSISIQIAYDEERQSTLLNGYGRTTFASLPRFSLREQLDELQSDPGFDTLLCLDSLSEVRKLPHQQEAALRVLKQMRGRALLADEVGLGKTIEAAMVLKELLQRRLVEKVLVFCPPSITLQSQWQAELYEKFNEVFLVMGANIDTTLAWHCSRLIVPYTILTQRFHAEEMLRQQYDLVILDEAHFLNDPKNEKILRVIQNLRKKYFLLVSATPMHNDLRELYNIVTLLRPGHFGSWDDFKSHYIDADNPTAIKKPTELRDVLKQVMVRNIRSEVMERYQKSQNSDFRFPKRNAIRYELKLSSEKARIFYESFRDFYQQNIKRIRNRNFLYDQMAELVERFTSSRAAFREQINILSRDKQRQLDSAFLAKLERYGLEYPDELVQPKIDIALRKAQEYVERGQKVLIFSQFNATTQSLYYAVRTTDFGKHCYLYDEQSQPREKDDSLREFVKARSGAVLFCPGEISEGVNLQFASVMINLDLPWDPMKIEQRIGRIQRLGSKFDEVTIINLVMMGTIEEEILRILEQKLHMFEAVVGQVEEIIGNLSDTDDFRRMIADLYAGQSTETTTGTALNPEERIAAAIDQATMLAKQDSLINPIFIGTDGQVDDDWDWS